MFFYFMIYEKYHDPIRVIADFSGKKVMPRIFTWGSGRYHVDRVLTVHSDMRGREPIHYFSVANQTEYFKLAFHTTNMQWYLLEHYQD